MARRVREKSSKRNTRAGPSDFDPAYAYMHLGYIETAEEGERIERALIANGIEAEKSITVSGCFSFRWKRGKYSDGLLNSIFMVFDYPGLPYIQGAWAPLNKGEGCRKRRRRAR